MSNNCTYDAITSGSCSRDPIGFEGSEWNQYEFINGRVMQAIDPYGTCPIKADPRTEQECCADASGTDIGKGFWGRAFCCDGRMVACVWIDHTPYRIPETLKDIRKCIKQHEDWHVRHAAPCPKKIPDQSEINYPPGMDDNRSHCVIYRRQFECLVKAFRKCRRKADCDPTELNQELNRIVERGKNACAKTKDKRGKPTDFPYSWPPN